MTFPKWAIFIFVLVIVLIVLVILKVNLNIGSNGISLTQGLVH
jgi:hypothetical protein